MHTHVQRVDHGMLSFCCDISAVARTCSCVCRMSKSRLSGLSRHACIYCSGTLLRHNQVGSAMFDNVVFQHEGFSWKIGCRPSTERQCVLHASHGAVSCGADPRSRFHRRLHGPRDEQPRCAHRQNCTQQAVTVWVNFTYAVHMRCMTNAPIVAEPNRC